MIKSFVINKYLSKEFLKVILNMLLGFFCIGFIFTLIEEINFFKDFDVGINLPILLTFLFVPSLLYKMFPFVVLFSGIWFFLKIKRTDEIIAMKVSGMSNWSIIFVPSILSLILGIFFVTSINPITSVLVKKYESVKGSFEKDQEYLAAITVNGIWIKEKDLKKNNIIRATNLENKYLKELTIYEFNKENEFVRRIQANSADISSLKWILHDVTILDSEGNYLSQNIDKLSYVSMYDIKKIKSLYSNLDTISFWNLDSEIKLLEERGYSTREMRARLQRSLAFPFFLLSMVLLSGVFTLSYNFNKNDNWAYVFIAIISSVLIFFFNDFSAVLGKTEKLPIELSVWMPIIIIFIFGTVGMINANQK